MAEPVQVSVQRNSQGVPVLVEATLSDTKNNNFQILGIPGQQYNLSTLTPVNLGSQLLTSTVDSTVSFLFDTSIQEVQPQQLVTFTDGGGNTIGLLGTPGLIYDLNVLTYLLAIVSAMDTFMSLQYGDDYNNVKHEKLMLVNLE